MKFINNKTGTIVDWDEKDGILIDCWVLYETPESDSKPLKKENGIVPQEAAETALETVLWASVGELRKNADTSKEARTKNGTVYVFNDGKWVKK